VPIKLEHIVESFTIDLGKIYSLIRYYCITQDPSRASR
jgi:hypothetical protein